MTLTSETDSGVSARINDDDPAQQGHCVQPDTGRATHQTPLASGSQGGAVRSKGENREDVSHFVDALSLPSTTTYSGAGCTSTTETITSEKCTQEEIVAENGDENNSGANEPSSKKSSDQETVPTTASPSHNKCPQDSSSPSTDMPAAVDPGPSDEEVEESFDLSTTAAPRMGKRMAAKKWLKTQAELTSKVQPSR